ncbi:MAG: transporter substrate-binding domain-containing protein [Rubrivivax sp.]|nr:transporter substrate-binding domain-containing protein [Rubrivivax sp.]
MLAAPLLRAQEPSALERVRKRGSLSVGLYNEMPPFHVAGQGIDVEIGRALAKALGVNFAPLAFNADENMNDDLRNLVWRGHYLGFGPADVLLHVPVDRPLMLNNPRVEIFAPYWRERIVIARDLQKVPAMETLQAFAGQRIAVPGQSLAGWLLIGADGGAYREQLSTRWKDGTEAARALLAGEVVAAAGMASELESTLAGQPRYAIEPLPLPRMRDGWAVGMAVKKEATDLAQALQGAVNQLAGSGALKEMFGKANVAWRGV